MNEQNDEEELVLIIIDGIIHRIPFNEYIRIIKKRLKFLKEINIEKIPDNLQLPNYLEKRIFNFTLFITNEIAKLEDLKKQYEHRCSKCKRLIGYCILNDKLKDYICCD